MRPVDARHLAEVDGTLGPYLDDSAILRLQTLEKDIPDRKTSSESLALSMRRPRILVGEVVARDSLNH
jgi:hypothetical protein